MPFHVDVASFFRAILSHFKSCHAFPSHSSHFWFEFDSLKKFLVLLAIASMGPESYAHHTLASQVFNPAWRNYERWFRLVSLLFARIAEDEEDEEVVEDVYEDIRPHDGPACTVL